MSRRTIPANTTGLTVTVGWDNPLGTFFAQVIRETDTDTDDDGDPIVFWIGGYVGEVQRAEDLVAPLEPYAVLTADIISLLRADRAACADQGLTPLQRELINRIVRQP